MTGARGTGRSRAVVDRRADRLVAVSSIVIAVGFLCAAALSTLLPAATRVGSWLPLHLALAGAASTVIVGVMPFFSAAIATTQPVDARIRWLSLGAVATGALGVSAGFATDADAAAAASGFLFVVGVVLAAGATLRPFRRGLGPRGGVIAWGYSMALLMVISGALLATLFLAGWPPVVGAWAYLKPAHAWLNLVGFVSLVIATTLLHFFPTVIGARIARVPAAFVTVLGLAAGSALVALGFVLRLDLLARTGAVAVLAGAAALAVYAAQVWRRRARWTTDRAWHTFAMGGLVSAIAWFEAGMLLAAGRVVLAGADPTAATSDALVGPVVIGWVGLAVTASATHLVPAVGPGDPTAHTRQRQLLGRGAWWRLILANAGVAGLALGLPASQDMLVLISMLAIALALGATAALLVAAVAVGLRRPPGIV